MLSLFPTLFLFGFTHCKTHVVEMPLAGVNLITKKQLAVTRKMRELDRHMQSHIFRRNHSIL